MTCDSIGSSYSSAATECPSGAYFNTLRERMQRAKNTPERRSQLARDFALQGVDNVGVQLAVSKIFLYGADGVQQSNDTALEYCKKAVVLDPENAHAQKQLGQLLRLTSDFDGAAAAFRKYLVRYPHDSYTHGKLGEVLRLQGQLKEAEMELAKADKGTFSYSQRAALQLKKEELREAQEREETDKETLKLKRAKLEVVCVLANAAVALCDDQDPFAKDVLRAAREKLRTVSAARA